MLGRFVAESVGPTDAGYTLKVDFSGLPSEERYRFRAFYLYGGSSVFAKRPSAPDDVGDGLFADPIRGIGSAYDDWASSFRPPRVDEPAVAFNTELLMYPAVGDSAVEYRLHGMEGGDDVGGFSGLLSGNSMVSNSGCVSPTAILSERLVRTFGVTSVSTVSGVVSVVCDREHGLSDGDAVTISGVPAGYDTSDHLMGKDGERYNGTFRVRVTGDTTFEYDTVHYTQNPSNYDKLSALGSVWEAVPSIIDGLSVSLVEDGMAFTGPGLSLSLIPGDYVCIVDDEGNPVLDGVCSVISTVGDTAVVDCDFFAEEGATYGFVYCGRVPSAAVPVNWPEYMDVFVSNSTEYDHTVNSFKITPSRDAWFDVSGGYQHGSDTVLKTGNGRFAAISFNVPTAGMGDDGGAYLYVYVSEMESSSGSIAVYQMSGNGWSYSTPYSEVKSLVTPILVASVPEIDNHGMSGNIGYVGMYIPGSVLKMWNDPASGYSPTVAIFSIGSGKYGIGIASSEDVSHPPYLVVSGGESSVVDPELVDLSTSVGSARPGDILRVSVVGGGTVDGNVFSNSVRFYPRKGGDYAEAFIVTGTDRYLDVVIPDSLDGNYDIYVYGSGPTGDTIPLSTGLKFFVEGSSVNRAVKLAEKIAPGTVPSGRIGFRAVYTKDIAYNGNTEIADGQALIQNVYSILLTRAGERLFDPMFGTHIEDKIFDVFMSGDASDILSECLDVITRFEPRVIMDKSESSASFDPSGNTLVIDLGLILPANGVVQHIRIPFKNRGG